MNFHSGWDISPLQEKHGYAHETTNDTEKIESNEIIKHSNIQCSQTPKAYDGTLNNGCKQPKETKSLWTVWFKKGIFYKVSNRTN